MIINRFAIYSYSSDMRKCSHSSDSMKLVKFNFLVFMNILTSVVNIKNFIIKTKLNVIVNLENANPHYLCLV